MYVAKLANRSDPDESKFAISKNRVLRLEPFCFSHCKQPGLLWRGWESSATWLRS